MNTRREAMYLALAAAEACWEAPLFLAMTQFAAPHPPLLFWLGILVLLLGFQTIYRALERANLSLRAQQALLVVALLLALGLFVRFHLHAGDLWPGGGWLRELFRRTADEAVVVPGEWLAAVILIYLWARGIKLARRSLTLASVGFSFRAGVVLLIGVVLALGLYLHRDISAFVAPYFFFALVAVALARVEEVSRSPGSRRIGFGGFWIGSTLGAAALLVLAGVALATFFASQEFRQALAWLAPVLVALWAIVFGLGVLVVFLLESLLDLLGIDLGFVGASLQQALQRLANLLVLPSPPPGAEARGRPAILGVLQVALTVGIPILLVALAIFFTWDRARRRRRGQDDEARESLLSVGALLGSLRAMLRAGRDRVGELAGLVDRFGLGARFLSAVSIRRIYVNLIRLAARAGYPRAPAQTPYDYLPALRKAFPDSAADVAVITEAYINARYGQVPDSRQELQRIRDCWQRVRAQASE